MSAPELFIGITSWNSEMFLGRCLRAIQATTPDVGKRVVVWDNGSTDASVRIALEHGADVRVGTLSQADALNALVDSSGSPLTLLLHADVVLLSPRWLERCRAHLRGDVALVSPEDIGCGPCSRPFGTGMPESSFLLFDTRRLHKLRALGWHRRGRLPLPRRAVDFYGPHITHHLPDRLRERGYAWQPMNVLVSPRCEDPIYRPDFKPGAWSDELAYLRYGLGNFYSLDGEITHYHNWYDRVPKTTAAPHATTGANGAGFPAAYVRRYTENFLRDYDAGRLVLPDPSTARREPVAL